MGINTPNMSIHNHSSLTKQHVQTFLMDDDEDDLLFNDEDIMSTEQIQQLFMESDDEDL